MCRSHYHTACKSKKFNSADWMRHRFYKHLRFFILFNFIFLIRAFNGHGFEDWLQLFLIWGPFVLVHYLKVRHTLRPAYAKSSTPDDDSPGWREKDLVKDPGK